jgi:tetratricopeptide (TPR) repeat protein
MLAASLLIASLVVQAPAAPARQPPDPPRTRPQTATSAADEFDTLRKQGEAARSAGKLEEAIALYRRAVRLRPRWIEGQWYLGTSAYDMGRYAECRDAFAKVVAAQPENGAAWAFKGLCEFQVRAYDAALSDLAKGHAVGLGDDARLVSVATYHRGILLTKSGQFEPALRVFIELAQAGDVPPLVIQAAGLAALRMPLLPDQIADENRDLVFRTGRAMLRAAGRMTAEAQQELAALAAQYPEVPNVHYAYGVLLLGDDPDAALRQFHEELRTSPDHAPARLQIAQELVRRGDPAAAQRWAEEAVQLAPRSFVAHRVLGQVQLATGDLAGAIASLETAVRLEPASPSARFNLARAYQRAGREADAARERAAFSRLERLQRAQRGGANAVGDPADAP